jgi:hypothetical protein
MSRYQYKQEQPCDIRRAKPGCSAGLRIDDFATAIIEGVGGLNDYERHELVIWPYSDRIAAAVWTMRCLSNPNCEGSDVALAAIIEQRETMKQNKVLG